jgi:H+-transporting ATPase
MRTTPREPSPGYTRRTEIPPRTRCIDPTRWCEEIINASELIPGDVIKLSLSGVVAADAKLRGAKILVGQSMLTGESAPIEAVKGHQIFAGTLVRSGERQAEVTATDATTKFGRTAHLVNSQQKAVLRVVWNFAFFNCAIILILVDYACILKMPVARLYLLSRQLSWSRYRLRDPPIHTDSAVSGHVVAKLGSFNTPLGWEAC